MMVERRITAMMMTTTTMMMVMTTMMMMTTTTMSSHITHNNTYTFYICRGPSILLVVGIATNLIGRGFDSSRGWIFTCNKYVILKSSSG